MRNLLLIGGFLGAGCSTLHPPSAAQLIAGQQAASQSVATRRPGIYDGPSSTRKKTTPLVFVDGRRYSSYQLKHLDPTSVDSARIIKPPISTALYGKRGRNGVVVFTTKAAGH